MGTVIKCTCGSDVYLATGTLPVSVQVSTEEKTLEIWGIAEEHFADLEVSCDGCGATLGPDGLLDLPPSPNRRADQDQTPALVVARSVIMEAIIDAFVFADLG